MSMFTKKFHLSLFLSNMVLIAFVISVFATTDKDTDKKWSGKKHQTLICDPERDIVFVPFSPISETDKFEVRIQIKNSGPAGDIAVEIYLDETGESSLAWRGKAVAGKNRYAFAQCFPNIIGKVGQHTIVVRFSQDGKEWQSVRSPFEVRKYTPNLIEGAFIMLGPPADRKPCSSFYKVKQLTEEQWKEQIDSFNELGFKTIIPLAIIQFEHYRSIQPEKDFWAHYPSKIYRKSDIRAEDPLKAIFEAADKNGQKVILPFGNNYVLCGRRLEVMEELWERYGKYKSFYGWYEALEPHLNCPADIFKSSITLLEDDRKKADELCPAKPILLSVACSVPAISEAIFNILAQGDLKADIIAPMDILGCTRGRPEQLKLNSFSFSVLKRALKNTKAHLWGNCESFDINDNDILVPRYLNGGFDGQAGFVQQMETIQPYCEKLITFEATGMFAKPGLTPEIGGEKAIEQYLHYAKYMKKPSVPYKNIAFGLPYTKSKEPDFPEWHSSVFWYYGEFNRDKDYFSTDGYIAGGREGTHPCVDIAKIFGYSINDESISVEISFDLKKQERIDMFRVADAPLMRGFKNANSSPEKIVVQTGNDLMKMEKIAELSEYVHGWAGTVLPEAVNCRYVKFTFFKKKNTNSAKSVMLINEIEICQKYE